MTYEQVYLHILYYYYLDSYQYGFFSQCRTKKEKRLIERLQKQADKPFVDLAEYLIQNKRLDLFVTALKLRFQGPEGFNNGRSMDDKVWTRLLLSASETAQTKRQRIVCRWMNQLRSVADDAGAPRGSPGAKPWESS